MGPVLFGFGLLILAALIPIFSLVILSEDDRNDHHRSG